MPRGPEHISTGERNTPPHLETGELIKRYEKRAEVSADHNKERAEIARAHAEALEKAAATERPTSEQNHDTEHYKPRTTVSKHKLDESFNKTMRRIQSELPLHQRIVSRLIHNPAVEKTSEIVGNTVARPNAILSGSIGALIVTGALYFTAKHFGFSLSGSETILSFLVGWLAGLAFDAARALIRGKS